jgi:hypothetical protein
MRIFFSENEELDDYITSHIIFLAVPYYLAELYLKLSTTKMEERLPNVLVAKLLIKRFIDCGLRLKLVSLDECLSYEQDNMDGTAKRNEKILRYRKENELKDNLQRIIQLRMNSFDETADEEFERETSILIVKSCLIKALNTHAMIKQEEEILNYHAELQKEGKKIEPPKEDNRNPQPPLVITNKRREIKNNAFQPGWNLPTMTVEQAGELELQECLQREKKMEEYKKQSLVLEYDGIDREEENLNIERLKQMDMDNYLEEHPKGSGNNGTKC